MSEEPPKPRKMKPTTPSAEEVEASCMVQLAREAVETIGADAVVIAQIARLELLAPEERLDPAKLMEDLKGSGKAAAYLPDVEAIVAHVVKHVQGGDVVCVFSNGGFGGIHGKLLERIGRV